MDWQMLEVLAYFSEASYAHSRAGLTSRGMEELSNFVSSTHASAGGNLDVDGDGSADWVILPNFAGLSSDSDGFYSIVSSQALVSYNSRSHQIVISIRGTEGAFDVGSWPQTALLIPSLVDPFRPLLNAVYAWAAQTHSTVFVAGHSMGGTIAEAIALEDGSKIQGGAFFGSPGSTLLLGSLDPERFLHVTREQDPAGEFPLPHASRTLEIDDYHFNGLPISAHDSLRDLWEVATIAASPLRDVVSPGTSIVAFLDNQAGVSTNLNSPPAGHHFHNITFGTPFSDTISYSGTAAISVDGGGGNDLIFGGNNNDILAGGAGADNISGGGGTDRLVGGLGNDTLSGGAGGDRYSIGVYEGSDIISDQGGDGVDAIALYTGSLFHAIDYNWFRADGNDLLIQATARDGTRAIDIRIVGMGLPSGTIENLLLYPDAGSTAVQNWDLKALWNELIQSGKPAPAPSPSLPPPPVPPKADDFGNSAATAAAISTAAAFAGGIQYVGDQDWFKLNLQAGNRYGFSISGGSVNGLSALAAPHLYLIDSGGALVADAPPVSVNAVFHFDAPSSGIYYLVAASDQDLGTGGYGLAVSSLGASPAPPPPPPPPPPDTPAPRLYLDTVEPRLAEDGTSLIFRVGYTGTLTSDVVIGWDVQGSGTHPTDAQDIGKTSGTVTLHQAQDYAYILVTPTHDQVDEYDEMFTLSIHVVSGNATIGRDHQQGTILNDDAGKIQPDADELNTGFDTATLMTPEVWSRGFINTPGDVDYFAVPLTAGATYDLIVNGRSDTSLIGGTDTGFIKLLDPAASLYDANHNLITSQFSAPVNSTRISYQFTPPTTGVYYLAVHEDGDNDIGQYFVQADVRIPADDYSASTATTGHLSEGQLATGSNERDGDDDWFGVDLTAGATYSFYAIDKDASSFDFAGYVWPGWTDSLHLAVKDGTGATVAVPQINPIFSPPEIQPQITFVAPATGRYYLSVSAPTSSNDYYVGYNQLSAPSGAQPQISQPGPAAGVDVSFGNVRDLGAAPQDSDTLSVGGFWSSGSSGSMLRFDLSSLPKEASYAAVDLYFTGTRFDTTTTYAALAMVLGVPLGNWDESSVLGAIGNYDFQKMLPAPGSVGWYRIPITDLYNAWQSGAEANNGIILLPTDMNGPANLFESSDSADAAHRPRLVVYERTPDDVTGTASFDDLAGTNQADHINGLDGDDLIAAIGGNDWIDGGPGADIIDGGDGIDTVSYASSPAAVSIDLGHNQNSGGTAESDSLLNVEVVEGSAFADTLRGSIFNETLRGNGGNDVFYLNDGGDDVGDGGAGDDGFYMGAALTAADRLDGGDGSNDQVGIQGDYTGANRLTLGALTLTNIESLVLLSGSDTRFGDSGTNLYSYDITTNDGNVAAGQNFIVNFNALKAGENVTFDGSAETDGHFTFFGGAGHADLTGGQGNDGFYFGETFFNVGDRINGGSGSDDQLGLRGDYTLVFEDGTITNIDTIVAISAGDTRFGHAQQSAYHYDITTADANVAAGQTLIVTGVGLAADETLTFNGSNETDGILVLRGGAGADHFTGGAGNDTLFGALGADVLDGGGGNDTFLYRVTDDSTSTSTDQILNFDAGDKIDLSMIDADPAAGGDQGFTFVSAFDGGHGEIRMFEDPNQAGHWFIQADTNGDTNPDLVIEVTTANSHIMSQNDFVL